MGWRELQLIHSRVQACIVALLARRRREILRISKRRRPGIVVLGRRKSTQITPTVSANLKIFPPAAGSYSRNFCQKRSYSRNFLRDPPPPGGVWGRRKGGPLRALSTGISPYGLSPLKNI